MSVKKVLAAAVVMASVPNMASAELIAALDFEDGGSDWTIDASTGTIPIAFELDGDPTNVGMADPGDNSLTGTHRLHQVVSAPTGFTMSNVMVTFEASGFSSWVVDGRLGLADSVEFALASEYADNAAQNPNGSVNVNVPLSLDASGDPLFTGVSSVFINVEIVKGLGTPWRQVNVRNIQVFADLTPVPEPASLALVGMGGVLMLARRRNKA